MFPEWRLNPGCESPKKCPFPTPKERCPINRGKASAHCSGTKFCVPWMEVSHGEVPLYILGRIILLHQRMEELENVKFIWTFWSHINVHLPLHIAQKNLVKPPFQYVDILKITHAQTHLLKQCNKQRWRSLSRIFTDFQHCIREGAGGEVFSKRYHCFVRAPRNCRLINFEFRCTCYITVPRKLFPR